MHPLILALALHATEPKLEKQIGFWLTPNEATAVIVVGVIVFICAVLVGLVRSVTSAS
jgi:hypothetical protein